MKSTRQLGQDAVNYGFNTRVSLKIYLKTCVRILDKAQSSFQNGDMALAFMFYSRYVDLCVSKLARHPEYVSVGLAQDPEIALYRQKYLQLVRLEVPAVLKIIEDLRKILDDQYSKHQQSLAKNIAKPTAVENRHHIPHLAQGSTPSTSQPLPLPPTFNEHRFNQSISFFATRETISENTTEQSKTTFHYPELPQLSFST
ncbi:Rfu1p KNAG_0E03030 [Huiozyma naganishii CBS 8797]|uniref:Regulator of free ubiquitin chains 1 n=1 Tax=Huiozyma naganishii (strain ATCC MYA-139 / BCRC 22969 / CBS 8797 / KCTC 17520 / NBRC 10181 / NCYC 3082 / Yp74L-3) TaxID=1071383 RepID=J7RZD5_HUIN7|nr:hypothetical protein KNAG_0E03030 [Kazachstania naganishii CBS 8797]CCK70562.1 hypothetical protein KNAG_0E03030 [Kazachstania naganishii CBS 8797]